MSEFLSLFSKFLKSASEVFKTGKPKQDQYIFAIGKKDEAKTHR